MTTNVKVLIGALVGVILALVIAVIGLTAGPRAPLAVGVVPTSKPQPVAPAAATPPRPISPVPKSPVAAPTPAAPAQDFAPEPDGQDDRSATQLAANLKAELDEVDRLYVQVEASVRNGSPDQQMLQRFLAMTNDLYVQDEAFLEARGLSYYTAPAWYRHSLSSQRAYRDAAEHLRLYVQLGHEPGLLNAQRKFSEARTEKEALNHFIAAGRR